MKKHLRLSIEGALRGANFSCFTDEDGKPIPSHQARAELLRLKGEGVKFIRIGECDNFSDEEGCLGHSDAPSEGAHQ